MSRAKPKPAPVVDSDNLTDDPGENPVTRRPTQKELRQRFKRVRQFVSEVIGQEANEPALWEQGLYQIWLWLVVERMVFHNVRLELDELGQVSKMTLDQSKVSQQQAKSNDKTSPAEPIGPGHYPLPDCFEDVVAQIYGTPEENSILVAEPEAEADQSSGDDETHGL
jgi:hypothetical protein